MEIPPTFLPLTDEQLADLKSRTEVLQDSSIYAKLALAAKEEDD